MRLRKNPVLLYVGNFFSKNSRTNDGDKQKEIAEAKELCVNVLTVIIRQCASTKS